MSASPIRHDEPRSTQLRNLDTMFFRIHILLVAFVLLLVAMVDAAPVKGLKQFKLKRGDATPLRRDNQPLPSRAVGTYP